MIKGSNLDGQIGFIDFSLVNAVTEGAHVDDNQLMVENKRLLGTRGTLGKKQEALFMTPNM